MAIVLVSSEIGEQMFERQHAEKLLQYEYRKGLHNWQLPETSEFEFSDGIIKRRNSRKNQKPEAVSRDTTSDSASE